VTSLLIIEANTPDMVARGRRGAEGFEQAFAHLAP